MATKTINESSPWSVFKQQFGSYKGVSTSRGQAQAEGWAIALARKLFGKKATSAQVRFIYDWELAEGGGGFNNPLNQGRDPKHPGYSGGTQFGGGASAYHSESQGLQGAADYLHMPAYSGVLAALKHNDISGAREALVKSPWASGHYGGKASNLPTTKLPSPFEGASGVGSSHQPWWDFVVPSTGQAAGRVAGDVGSGVGKGAGVVGSGITSLLKNPAVILIVVVVLIVIIKK